MPSMTRLGIATPLLGDLLVLTACGGSGGTEGTDASSPTSSTSTSTNKNSGATSSKSPSASSTKNTDSSSRSTTTPTTTTTTTPTTTSNTSSATTPTSSTSRTTSTTTTAAAPVGPQTCGQVTTVPGGRVTVRIVSGDVDCAFAEGLLTTYYQDPPVPLQGSGGFVEIDGWECMTATLPSGGATTCASSDGGKVTTSGVATPEPTESPDPPSQSSAAPSAGGSCAQIDQPTLDQMFPDGVQDEQRCAAFISGEAGH